MLGGAFNLHFADLGETYVARNLAAWAVIGLSLIALWWRPLRRGEIGWSPLWAVGLLAPVCGAFVILSLNILGGYEHFHMGHYFMPFMLLAFALFILGLLQHGDALPDLSVTIIFIGVLFLPQFIFYLLQENPIISALAPQATPALPAWLAKPSAGFGQYNLLGSFIAGLVVMAVCAFTLVEKSAARRAILAALIIILTFDLPFIQSKTSLLGIVGGFVFLGAHLYASRAASAAKWRFLTCLLLVLGTYFLVVVAMVYLGQSELLASRSASANAISFLSRLTMWILGFWGFVEAPLFGHGLGSYLTVYMAQFAQYGLAENHFFMGMVTVPHNLFIHILAETGLFGLLLIIGPFIWLAWRVFMTHENRWLIAALVFPIGLHTQVEYPYIASGAHYWLFALALVFGLTLKPDAFAFAHRFSFATQRVRYAALGGFSAACILGVWVSVSLIKDVRDATLAYHRAVQKPLYAFLDDRANAPELGHPIIGKRLRAISNISAIKRLLAARQYRLLRRVALPYFEAYVLSDYPVPRVWELAVETYVALGEMEKARAVIAQAMRYDLEIGAALQAVLQAALKRP